ncbi:hypothetical protein M413DRAFT_22966 [Hebeloma cylindrosporum]|uniref:Uncharacterized protein n=1 Tax=Hebeloma cylindrosporum TaxID=76867 RepID=A0A0C3CIA9_HEBCY|nr:hypothetical protein M413DRAFT_22966 [Hebeloma cylindrosporum h7]
MTSNVNRLRILVALAALKHKPAEQTFSGYVLDLRVLFPCGPTDGGEAYWRDHAVKLEKDYAALKIRLEEKEIQSFVSASGGETSGEPVASLAGRPGTRPEVEVSKKKAGKKKHAVDRIGDRSGHRDGILLEAEFEKLCRGSPLPGDSGRLFSSLETLYRLSTCYAQQPGFPLELYLSATRRVLDAVSVTFGRSVETKLNANRMQTINTALRLLIEWSFPIVLACGVDPQGKTIPFASLLNSVLCSVLMPLVRTFYVLSTQHLQCLLVSPEHERSSGPTAVLDHRPGLLTVFRSILAYVNLNASPSGIRREPPDGKTNMAENYRLELSLLHHSLILDTLRHLQDIVLQTVIEIENQKSGKHGRVMRLSIKNTIWYICSALHIVIGLEVKNASGIVPTTAVTCSDFIDAQIARLKLLKATALDSFVEFLSRLDKTRRMNAVTRRSALDLDSFTSTTSGTNGLLDATPIPAAPGTSEYQGPSFKKNKNKKWRALAVYKRHD